MKVTILFIAALGLANASVILREQRPEVHRVGSSPTLEALLEQFAAFIPTEKVLDILLTHLQTDPDVQEVFAFLQGDDFRTLVTNLEGVKELNDFLAWVYKEGVPIYSDLNAVLDILGDPEVHPSGFRRSRKIQPRSGLTDMIQEIENVLPIDEIVNWYFTTCQPDPEFQDLLKQLRSPEFLVIVNDIKTGKYFDEINTGLDELGIDTVEVDEFLHNFFGW